MTQIQRQCMDAVSEAECLGIPFTEIAWRYRAHTGELWCIPRYNSEGLRLW